MNAVSVAASAPAPAVDRREKKCGRCDTIKMMVKGKQMCDECRIKGDLERTEKARLRKRKERAAEAQAKAANTPIVPKIPMCNRCQDVEVKFPYKYCSECRDAVSQEQNLERNNKAKETYRVKKELQADAAQSEFLAKIGYLQTKNMDMVNKLTIEEMLQLLTHYYSKFDIETVRETLLTLYDTSSDLSSEVGSSVSNQEPVYMEPAVLDVPIEEHTRALINHIKAAQPALKSEDGIEQCQ